MSRARVRSSAQRQRGQVQGGRPALGPRLQPRDVRGRELETEGIDQECRRLLVAEAKVAGAHLGQLAPGAQAAQRQRRILPRREDEAQRARRALDHVGEGPVHVRVGDDVVVLDDEHEVTVEAGDVVEEQGQHDLDEIRAGAAQGRQRPAPELGLDPLQGRRDVGEEAGRVVVVLVERQPRDPRARPRRPPIRPAAWTCRTRAGRRPASACARRRRATRRAGHARRTCSERTGGRVSFVSRTTASGAAMRSGRAIERPRRSPCLTSPPRVVAPSGL